MGARVLPAALALALALPAAGAGELALDRSGGVLGEALAYELAGDPFQIALLLPSATAGPTPLALVDPGDPRVLAVGLDLVHLAAFVPLGPTGQGGAAYPLPASPALAGVALHAQALTLLGPGTLVDELSNATKLVLAPHDTVHAALGPSHEPRQGHTATPLSDGRVLVAGGDRPDASGGLTTLDSLEVFDPLTQSSTLLAATLAHPRSTHSATLLADGRVLLAGGYDASGTVVTTVEIFDPATSTVSPAAPLGVPRTQHTATRLADGRVLVVGGTSKFDLDDVIGSLGQAKRSTEIYDPATDAWAPGPDVPVDVPAGTPLGVVGHAASLLASGDVLVSGGAHVASILFGIPIPNLSRKSFRYVAATGAFVPAGDLPARRVFHGQTTLPDGRVLAVGGADGDVTTLSFHALASTAVWAPATGTWSAGPSLTHARAYPEIVLAPDEVLVLGGLATVAASAGTGTPETAIDAAPLALGAFSHVADGLLPRQLVRGVAVDGGARVVLLGTGDDGTPTPSASAEVYVR